MRIIGDVKRIKDTDSDFDSEGLGLLLTPLVI